MLMHEKSMFDPYNHRGDYDNPAEAGKEALWGKKYYGGDIIYGSDK